MKATLQPAHNFQLSAWFEYDLEGIKHAPATSGLYAIVRLQTQKVGNKNLLHTSWIYIGKHEKSIWARVLAHYSGTSHNAERINSHNPTHFAFVSIPKGPLLDSCEIASIKKYQPVCNDQHT